MLDWIISLSLAAAFIALGVFAHAKIGTVRKKDQRPHQVPWGLVMVGCVFGLFLIVVHIMNLVGVDDQGQVLPEATMSYACNAPAVAAKVKELQT